MALRDFKTIIAFSGGCFDKIWCTMAFYWHVPEQVECVRDLNVSA